MQIDRLSHTLRAGEVGELVAEAEAFARRQPSLFIAGAVAAGFVIGRLLARPSATPPPARGYAMSGGEHSLHPAEPQPEELVAGAEVR